MSQSLYNSALDFYQSDQLIAAETTLQNLLQSQPQHARSLHLLGIIYYQTNRLNLAIKTIAQALTIEPRNINFLNNYGLTLRAANQFEEAIKAYQQALLLNAKDADVQLNLANLFMQIQRFEEAAGYYRKLIKYTKSHQAQYNEINQALTFALTQLGNSAFANNHFSQAEAIFAEAVQLNPQENSLYFNLANAERELGKTKLAIQHYQKAISLKPNDADAFNNLGNVQRELGQLDAAINSYQQALTINPALYHAKVHMVHQKQHICDWGNLAEDIEIIRDWVKHVQEAQVSPFAFLAMENTTPAEQLTCANHWISHRFSALKNRHEDAFFESPSISKQKIRIGYLSADFRLHPLAYLITDLISLHDRSTFEVIAFSFGANDHSEARQRLIKAFDHFHDIRQLSEIAAAKKIHAENIDILVDLTGFTQTSRSGIMLFRPAKIHVNWLGFAGTMGYLDATKKQALFDYLLTDKIITPPEHAEYYAEKLAYLPCYQPNNRERPSGKTPTRADCKLAENAFVFCSFNQSFKISPAMFSCWMRVLKAVPNSLLWLLDCHASAKKNLLLSAKQLGVDASRLVFAPRVCIEEHLARHAHADLFLDTAPYNAHTTCSDALWMDVPVLTCMGNSFASRVAASLLSTVNLPELITESMQDYENKAIYYAKMPTDLISLKQKLAKNKTTSILFDTPNFTKALESSYKEMLHALG